MIELIRKVRMENGKEGIVYDNPLLAHVFYITERKTH